MQQAKSSIDIHAFGSHIQWGRKADGHELIHWTGLNDRFVGRNTLLRSDNPQTTEYINSYLDWRHTRDDTLWNNESNSNNVCPIGFRVPTSIELNNERSTWGSNNSQGAFLSSLKLTLSGMRGENNYLLGAGRFTFYATSTPYGEYATSLFFHPNYAILARRTRAHGLSVRCIEN
jgi:hypothetical protein